MFRLSKLLEKLEDKLDARFKSWLARNKAKLPMRVPAVIVGWYFCIKKTTGNAGGSKKL